MAAMNSYKAIALSDLKAARALQELGLYNQSAKFYQQFVEKSLKEIIDQNISDSKETDLLLIRSHNTFKLAKRVCEILNYEFEKSWLGWFRTVKDYYYEVSYPGDDFTEITEKDIVELASWINEFEKCVICLQHLTFHSNRVRQEIEFTR